MIDGDCRNEDREIVPHKSFFRRIRIAIALGGSVALLILEVRRDRVEDGMDTQEAAHNCIFGKLVSISFAPPV